MNPQTQSQFAVGPVPYHTHNGIDSPSLPSQSLAGYMQTAIYDPAGIAQQVVGTFAVQTLTNKTIDGGSNTITGITEDSLSLSDVTTDNVSDTAHGFAPKLPNDNTVFLDGTGNYTAPTVGAVTTLLAIYTAGQSLTSGQAVAIQIKPANNIAFDASTAQFFTTSLTTTFTVGNNSNRALVVLILANNSTVNTITSCVYNGSNLSLIVDSGAGTYGHAYAFYLNAPTVGSHTLTIGASGSTTQWTYYVYSYYNVAQSGQPEVNASTISGTLPQSLNITPISNGAMALGVIGGDNFSGTGFTNNIIKSISGTWFGQAGDSGPIYPQQTVSFTQNATTNKLGVAVVLAPYTVSGTTNEVYLASSALAQSCSSFIGFSQGNYSALSNANIAIAGLSQSQSGLTVGVQYYINDTLGSIGTAAGTVTRKAGIATLASSILITNLW